MSGIGSLHRLTLFICMLLMGGCCRLCAQQTSLSQSPAPEDTLEGKRSYAIPLVYDPLLAPFPIVYVSINEQAPLPFLLDTGTSATLILTPEAARTLRLLPTGKTELVNHKIKAAVTRLSSIRFPLAGNDPQHKMMSILNPEDASPYILKLPPLTPAPDGKPIAGIVGVIALMKSTARLDFAAKLMTLFPDPHPPLRLAQSDMLPLTEQKSGLYSVTLQTDATHTYDCLLDTGCAITEVPPAAAQALQVRETPFTYSSWLVGGYRQSASFGVVSHLPLGTLTTSEIEVAYAADEKAAGKAVLGINFLSRYRLIFDFPNKQLHLQQGANYEAMTRLPGLPVLHVTRRGSQVQVAYVLPGSAAYRAGIRKGDVLLSVDDTLLEGLSTTVLEALVNGYGGTEAHLQVQQNGQVKAITYPRYSLAVIAAAMDIGLNLRMSETGRLFVNDAAKSFPAYESGLRKGDEILSIDGQMVQTTNYEIVLNLLSNPKTNPIPLCIQRKDEAHSRLIRLKWQDNPNPT